jgi:hypothetical protein
MTACWVAEKVVKKIKVGSWWKLLVGLGMVAAGMECFDCVAASPIAKPLLRSA